MKACGNWGRIIEKMRKGGFEANMQEWVFRKRKAIKLARGGNPPAHMNIENNVSDFDLSPICLIFVGH